MTHHGFFKVNLGRVLQHVSAISVEAASIPNTFESVRTGERLVLNVGATDVQVPLTAGSYTSTSVLTMLKTALEEVDSGRTYTVTYDNSTFRIKVARDTGTFTLRAGSKRVSRVLGFSETAGTAAAALTASAPAQLGVNSIILASRALRSSLLGERAGFAVVHLTEGSGGVVNYTRNQYSNMIHLVTPIRTLESIDIMLQTVHQEDGIMDPQGLPVDITLRISHEPF
jgi:hypothetical protein